MSRCRSAPAALGGLVALVSPLAAVLAGTPAAATEGTAVGDSVTAHFSAHSPGSEARLGHEEWSAFLSRTVMYAGYATRRLTRGDKRTWAGSRMRFGNTAPSRFDNNRIVLSGFTDEHLAFVRGYRKALEAVPAQVPLAALNRAEQLAYWLNLYNAHALEHVAAHYPEETTDALRSPPGAPPEGVWYEQTLEVDGVPLSLRDIETRILFPIWKSPLVLYGLWQGAIGGPRLPTEAYEGSRVWRMLEDNADEFVNSNRGMKPRNEELRVSLLYGWGEALFEDDDQLLAHVYSHMRPPFSEGVARTRRVRVDLYDWHLADLSGGTHHRGDWNTNAALIGAIAGTGSGTNLLISQAMRSDTTRRALPPQTLELLRGMERHNERERSPVVTVEECEGEGGCREQAPASGTAEDPSGGQTPAGDDGGRR